MTTDILLEPKTHASAECTPNPPARKAFLDNRDDDGVGRDTRRVSREELMAAGHKPMSPLNAIRARCVDCCAGELSQVRRCAHLDCPSWPYRMGTNPWRKKPSEAQRQSAARLACGMKNHGVQLGGTDDQAVPAAILPPAKLSTGGTAVLGHPRGRAAGSKETLQEELRAAGHRPMSPLKALRLRCIDCCADQPNEVRLCTAVTCPLFPFRTRKNPWQAPLSAEVLEARRRGGQKTAAQLRKSRQGAGSGIEPMLPATDLPAGASASRTQLTGEGFQIKGITGEEAAR